MATLHKFKLLATQCAVATSPTRSPTTSPVIHLRRRKTLRMLLRKLPNSDVSTDRRRNSPEKVRHKLKDLFVSSPPPLKDKAPQSETLLPATGSSGSSRGGSNWRRVGPRSLRPFSAALRQRLLRRAWRPVLVSIPE